jgi:hypothetical protein
MRTVIPWTRESFTGCEKMFRFADSSETCVRLKMEPRTPLGKAPALFNGKRVPRGWRWGMLVLSLGSTRGSLMWREE